jgi:hypothetical protein
MKRVSDAFKVSLKTLVLLAGVNLALAAMAGGALAGVQASAVVSSYGTDIRVWMDNDMDIYHSEDDLVFYVRASRDCYATVYVIDTDGFIHVIFPLSPMDNAFIKAGFVYRFAPRGAEIFYSSYPRGIAYIFAVSSPLPFVYSDFGPGIFGRSSIYRIYGDPFIACRRFYLSLLPGRIALARVSISFSYFYMREWARYPRYLCSSNAAYSGGVQYGYHRDAYRLYRCHQNDPYRVLRPENPVPRPADEYTGIVDVRSKPVGGIAQNRNLEKHKTPRQVSSASTPSMQRSSARISVDKSTPNAEVPEKTKLRAGNGITVKQSESVSKKTAARTSTPTIKKSTVRELPNVKKVVTKSSMKTVNMIGKSGNNVGKKPLLNPKRTVEVSKR